MYCIDLSKPPDRQIDALVYEFYGLTEGEIKIVEEFMNEEELEAMNISFLREHVVQLTQSISQLALKPGEEEIKKKAGGNSGS